MILDLLWMAGIVLSVLVLLGGAGLVLMACKPRQSLLGRKSADPLPLLAGDSGSNHSIRLPDVVPTVTPFRAMT